MEFAVEIENLTKKYSGFRGFREFIKAPFKKKKTLALDNVGLKVRKGEVLGLIGPNGAGKTTIIRVLCTFLLADSGKVTVNGFDVVKEQNNVKKSIGLVNTEERSFFWRLTGKQNLEFFGRLHGLSEKVLKQRIHHVFELLKMQNVMNELYYTYSTGMKQRLSIARGLLNDPELLLLDEPTLGLDPIIAVELQKFFKETIQKKMKKTVLIATHDLNEAKLLCDRIAIIHKGKIVAVKKSSEFESTEKLQEFFKKVTVE